MESHKGEYFAHCTMCESDVKISHEGRSNIKEHLDTKH